MNFMTVDPTVLHECIISCRDRTELPAFIIEGPGCDVRAKGRVVRITHIHGEQFEIETNSIHPSL